MQIPENGFWTLGIILLVAFIVVISLAAHYRRKGRRARDDSRNTNAQTR
jgi:hypothetical protein